MEYVLEFILPLPSHLCFPLMRMAGRDIQSIKDNFFKTKLYLRHFCFDIIKKKKNVAEIRLLCLCLAGKKINKIQCVQMKGNYPM